MENAFDIIYVFFSVCDISETTGNRQLLVFLMRIWKNLKLFNTTIAIFVDIWLNNCLKKLLNILVQIVLISIIEDEFILKKYKVQFIYFRT